MAVSALGLPGSEPFDTTDAKMNAIMGLDDIACGLLCFPILVRSLCALSSARAVEAMFGCSAERGLLQWAASSKLKASTPPAAPSGLAVSAAAAAMATITLALEQQKSGSGQPGLNTGHKYNQVSSIASSGDEQKEGGLRVSADALTLTFPAVVSDGEQSSAGHTMLSETDRHFSLRISRPPTLSESPFACLLRVTILPLAWPAARRTCAVADDAHHLYTTLREVLARSSHYTKPDAPAMIGSRAIKYGYGKPADTLMSPEEFGKRSLEAACADLFAAHAADGGACA